MMCELSIWIVTATLELPVSIPAEKRSEIRRDRQDEKHE